MKVYIVTTEPFPNGLAATGRIKCYAKALISEGVDVDCKFPQNRSIRKEAPQSRRIR